MDEKLKVDYETLETALSQMQTAYKEFSTFTENTFETEIGYLEEMNSDFVDKLTRVLEISKKWNIDTINENVGKYIQEAETIYQEIKKLDETLAK